MILGDLLGHLQKIRSNEIIETSAFRNCGTEVSFLALVNALLVKLMIYRKTNIANRISTKKGTLNIQLFKVQKITQLK